MLFGKSKGLIGLDIGSSSIKLVELRSASKAGRNWKLANLGIINLPPEAIVDGSIMDSQMVVDATNQLFIENHIKGNDIAIAVSGHSVIIKKITVNYMSEEELVETMQVEAESFIPFDVEDVNLDYQILGEGERADGNMDVLLVAAKKEKVSEYMSVIQQAGKSPAVVDVDSFCIQNAFTENYEPVPDQVTALINVGASVTNINILKGAQSVFWRDITTGGNVYTDAIQKELNVGFEVAEVLKRGEPAGDIPFEKVIPILKNMSHEVVNEIQKTFDFFKATTNLDRVAKLYLSGGGSRILNFDTELAERFGSPVEFLDPFRNISINEKQFNPQTIQDLKASCAVVVGLAMRKPGDK